MRRPTGAWKVLAVVACSEKVVMLCDVQEMVGSRDYQTELGLESPLARLLNCGWQMNRARRPPVVSARYPNFAGKEKAVATQATLISREAVVEDPGQS
jgi:hypothetical protein